jgi:hypothetical protein
MKKSSCRVKRRRTIECNSDERLIGNNLVLPAGQPFGKRFYGEWQKYDVVCCCFESSVLMLVVATDT